MFLYFLRIKSIWLGPDTNKYLTKNENIIGWNINGSITDVIHKATLCIFFYIGKICLIWNMHSRFVHPTSSQSLYADITSQSLHVYYWHWLVVNTISYMHYAAKTEISIYTIIQKGWITKMYRPSTDLSSLYCIFFFGGGVYNASWKKKP